MIDSSYPNEYYKSKHERFKGMDICMCECDCDMTMTSEYGYKKGDTCYLCRDGDHAQRVYKNDRL